MPTPSATDRADARREQLLDELTALFLAEGFVRFGVGDLAARLRCSRSTLYLVASSKEQIILAVVRAYFRRAAVRIDERLARVDDPAQRLAAYLRGVAEELAPASEQFHADLAAYAPAREIYEADTAHAARRVEQLVRDGVRSGVLRRVDAGFVGAAVSQVMHAIQRGALGEATGLSDARAYRALADLVVEGLRVR